MKAGRLGERVHEVSATLQELLQPVTDMAEVLLDHLSRAKPAELEVEFGVALSAEAGAVITISLPTSPALSRNAVNGRVTISNVRVAVPAQTASVSCLPGRGAEQQT